MKRVYITMGDFMEGEQLLMTMNKKYPVTVQRVISALADAAVERKYQNCKGTGHLGVLL